MQQPSARSVHGECGRTRSAPHASLRPAADSTLLQRWHAGDFYPPLSIAAATLKPGLRWQVSCLRGSPLRMSRSITRASHRVGSAAASGGIGLGPDAGPKFVGMYAAPGSCRRTRYSARCRQHPIIRCGSWLCENAGVLRRRRMLFSSAGCLGLLARGSSYTHRWAGVEIPQTRRFLQLSCTATLRLHATTCRPRRRSDGRNGIGF